MKLIVHAKSYKFKVQINAQGVSFAVWVRHQINLRLVLRLYKGWPRIFRSVVSITNLVAYN